MQPAWPKQPVVQPVMQTDCVSGNVLSFIRVGSPLARLLIFTLQIATLSLINSLFRSSDDDEEQRSIAINMQLVDYKRLTSAFAKCFVNSFPCRIPVGLDFRNHGGPSSTGRDTFPLRLSLSRYLLIAKQSPPFFILTNC
jgi:hypothetical protein